MRLVNLYALDLDFKECSFCRFCVRDVFAQPRPLAVITRIAIPQGSSVLSRHEVLSLFG
jgi:hypothetical protein